MYRDKDLNLSFYARDISFIGTRASGLTCKKEAREGLFSFNLGTTVSCKRGFAAFGEAVVAADKLLSKASSARNCGPEARCPVRPTYELCVFCALPVARRRGSLTHDTMRQLPSVCHEPQQDPIL
ncbi:hypothetical protein ACU8KH_04714 [Lachancea thermotolerans]